MATTIDPLLAQRMAELPSHGIVREAERFERPAAGTWDYEQQQQLGFNYRITDIQAALSLSQLPRSMRSWPSATSSCSATGSCWRICPCSCWRCLKTC
jgi:dTDP-4-amino-4,6-dideoxygalactose transaminase